MTFVHLILCQIEVSEMYFVPDPGASKQQCDIPVFKPVSGKKNSINCLFYRQLEIFFVWK